MAIKKKSKEKKDIKPTELPVKESTYNRVEPDEFYTAKFIKCHIEEGNYGPYARLEFKLLSGNIEDSEESAKGMGISAFCPAEVTPKNNAWDLFKSIMDKTPVVGEPIDITPYYGNKYKVLITDKKSKKSNEVNQQITKIKQIKKSK
jgi:hypothetical protein